MRRASSSDGRSTGDGIVVSGPMQSASGGHSGTGSTTQSASDGHGSRTGSVVRQSSPPWHSTTVVAGRSSTAVPTSLNAQSTAGPGSQPAAPPPDADPPETTPPVFAVYHHEPDAP